MEQQVKIKHQQVLEELVEVETVGMTPEVMEQLTPEEVVVVVIITLTTE